MVAPNLQRDTLMPVIRAKVVPDSVVYTDNYNIYDVLDVSEFRHHRINHQHAFVAEGSTTLMASRISGTTPNARSAATTAFRASTSDCSSRKFRFKRRPGRPTAPDQALGRTEKPSHKLGTACAEASLAVQSWSNGRDVPEQR